MNKQTEALKMVTDILDDELWFPNKYPDEVVPVCFIEALNACKEALEQPAQEALKIEIRLEVLNELLERMVGVYPEYYKEIVEDMIKEETSDDI